MNEEENMMKIK